MLNAGNETCSCRNGFTHSGLLETCNPAVSKVYRCTFWAGPEAARRGFRHLSLKLQGQAAGKVWCGHDWLHTCGDPGRPALAKARQGSADIAL